MSIYRMAHIGFWLICLLISIAPKWVSADEEPPRSTLQPGSPIKAEVKSEPSSLLPADLGPDAIVRAKQFAEEATSIEKELDANLQEIKNKLGRYNPNRPVTESDSPVDSLRSMIKKLRAESTFLLENNEQFQINLRAYDKVLQGAPAAFRRAAETYKAYAGEEAEEFIKAEYEQMAVHSENIASKLERRRKSITGDSESVIKKMQFVKRSVVFLDRADQFLTTIESLEDGNQAVQEYMKRLDNFVLAMRETIRAFDQFATKLSGEIESESESKKEPSKNAAPTF